MSLPRVIFIVPGLLAGLLVPALASAHKSLPAGDVGMTSDNFAQSVVTIHRDQRLTFFNNSDVIHVIGPGRSGHIIGTERNVPITGFHLMQSNSLFRTPRWKTPGTYWLTCSVHMDMTLKVIVIR